MMAKEHGVDVSDCVEKQDIIERLEQGDASSTSTGSRDGTFTRSRIQSKTGRAQAAVGLRGLLGALEMPASPVSTASNKSDWSSVSVSVRSCSSHRKSQAAPTPIPTAFGVPQNALASNRVPLLAQASKLEPPRGVFAERSPSESLRWSDRVRRYFDCHPGFSAELPPQAEVWTDTELNVYFGSNGEIWPTGKRPSWMPRPGEERKHPEAQAARRKLYPDLKEHFETLGLAETTPHEVIRRHYRRLARDSHPDKHPDDPLGAGEAFQKIAAAYEAIRDRLHF